MPTPPETPISDKNAPEVNSSSLMPLSNAELELSFQEILEKEASDIERSHLAVHPWLYTYALLCFVRGCDWANGRYVKAINRVLEKLC